MGESLQPVKLEIADNEIRVTPDHGGVYKCPYCGHKIIWSEYRLFLLRYCWYCGKQFLAPVSRETLGCPFDETEGE